MDDTQYRNPARAVLIDAGSEVNFLRVRVTIEGLSQPNNRIGRSQLDLRKWRSLHRNYYFPFLLNLPRQHDFSARGSLISSVQYRARKQAVVAPVSGAAVSRDTVPARLSYFVLGRSGTARQQLPMAPDSCKMAA